LLRQLSEIEIVAEGSSKYTMYFGIFEDAAAIPAHSRQAREWRAAVMVCDCPKCVRFPWLFALCSQAGLIEIFGCNLLDDETQREACRIVRLVSNPAL